MDDHAGRFIDGQPAEFLKTQAQVGILATVPVFLVEAARLVETGFAHQHAGGGDGLINAALIDHGKVGFFAREQMKGEQGIVVPAIGQRDAGVLDRAIGIEKFASHGGHGGVAVGQGKERSEPVGLRLGVVVEKQTIAAAGGAGALIAGFGETGVFRIEHGAQGEVERLGDADRDEHFGRRVVREPVVGGDVVRDGFAQAHGRLLGAQEIRRAVGRAVIHDDDFVARGGGVGLEGAKALACQIEFVEGGNDNRGFRPFGGGGLGRRGKSLLAGRRGRARHGPVVKELEEPGGELLRQSHIALGGHDFLAGLLQLAGLFHEGLGVPHVKDLAAAQRGLA